MVGGSCKEKILGRMHLLTNTEAKLAAYILEHYEEVLNCNITELAEEDVYKRQVHNRLFFWHLL